MTAGSSIRQSNAGNYDFHIAIHSNAAPPGKEGQVRGTVIFYYPSSTNGKRMADILQQNFKKIYPLPNLVNTMPTTTLGEVARTKAPAVLIEVAYHDNPEDRNWIKNNIDLIGRTIVQSAAQYFNLAPQTAPSGTGGRTGKVTLNSGYLNIRREPSLNAAVIDMAPNGATLTVLNTVGDWYQVTYKGKNGYAFSKYVKVQ
jgi:N-acetylmuramoyl-L-alanine amidase